MVHRSVLLPESAVALVRRVERVFLVITMTFRMNRE